MLPAIVIASRLRPRPLLDQRRAEPSGPLPMSGVGRDVGRVPSPEEDAFLERLQRELPQWRKEGILSSDQAESLLARYHLLPGETPSTLRRSRIVLVLAILGAVLVGVGVLLVIGANWQGIPKWTRLALLFVATGAAYAAGYRLAYHSTKYPRLGVGLLLLGSLLWGASIFLIGQMYHQGGGGGGERTALAYWFLGVLPLAYLILSLFHLALSLVLATIWLFMTLDLYVRTLDELSVALFILPIGVALYSLSRVHSASPRVGALQPVYQWFGLLFLFGALYALSFSWSFLVWGYPEKGAVVWFFWLPFAAAAVPCLSLIFLRAVRDRASLGEALGLLFLLALAISTALVLSSLVHAGGLDRASNYLRAVRLSQMALANLVLLAAVVGLIALGWIRNRPGLANFGLFVFFLQVVTRYFDLLGGLLSSGFMFIGAGLLLLGGGAALERSRRKLLTAMAERTSP